MVKSFLLKFFYLRKLLVIIYYILLLRGFLLRGCIKLFLVALLLSINFSFSQEQTEHKLNLSFGINKADGNTKLTLINTKINYRYTKGEFQIKSDMNSLFSQSRSRKTAERISFDNRFEIKQKPYFYFLDLNYYRNPFQSYQHSIMFSFFPGIGRYIYDDKDLYLTVSYYPYYVYNHLNTVSIFSGSNKEDYILHNIEMRFSKSISDNTNFKTKFIYKISDRTIDDYFLLSESSLTTTITKRIALELSYNFYYQNIPVLTKINRVDTIFSTLIRFDL